MYLLCFTLVFIFSFFDAGFARKGKLAFVIVFFISLFLYAALRQADSYGDAMGYAKKFVHYSKYSFSEMLSLYNTSIKSPTFHLLGWIVSRIRNDAQIWLAFIGGLYAFCTSVLIYKESKNVTISALMVFALGYFMFSLTGLRQTISLAIIMLSYFAIKNKKMVLFIGLVFLATLFHTSAIIFIIAYPISHLKIGFKHFAVALFALVMFVAFQSAVRYFIANILGDVYLSGYAKREIGLSFSGLLIQCAIFVFSLFYYKQTISKFNTSIILYNLSFVGMVFQLFASMIAEMFRISMYFSFFNILLVPMVLSSIENKKTKLILEVALIYVLLLYNFRGGIPNYEFFWN